MNGRVAVLFLVLLTVPFAGISQQAREPVRVSVFFGGGSYWIDEGQRDRIRFVVDSLQHIERYEISIHSHTDDIGGAEYNKWLSQRRSGAAMDVLKEMAIPEHQITLKDFGQFNPIYSNDSWLGRRMNRRVDILFWPIVL